MCKQPFNSNTVTLYSLLMPESFSLEELADRINA